MSGLSPAAGTAFYLFFKKDGAKRFHTSKFDICYSIFCGSMFHPSEVSYKRTSGLTPEA
jgi:hypothetical protein